MLMKMQERIENNSEVQEKMLLKMQERIDNNSANQEQF